MAYCNCPNCGKLVLILSKYGEECANCGEWVDETNAKPYSHESDEEWLRRQSETRFLSKDGQRYSGRIACPYCRSYRVRAATWDDKKLSVAFWGITASPKTGKNYKCDNCGRMW